MSRAAERAGSVTLSVRAGIGSVLDGDATADGTDPGDDRGQLGAVAQVLPRVARMPDAARGPGRDDVAGLQREDVGDVRDERLRREDEVVGRGRLHGLAV